MLSRHHIITSHMMHLIARQGRGTGVRAGALAQPVSILTMSGGGSPIPSFPCSHVTTSLHHTCFTLSLGRADELAFAPAHWASRCVLDQPWHDIITSLSVKPGGRLLVHFWVPAGATIGYIAGRCATSCVGCGATASPRRRSTATGPSSLGSLVRERRAGRVADRTCAGVAAAKLHQ